MDKLLICEDNAVICKDNADVLSKRKPKNSAKNLSTALQVVIDPLDNQLGYKGLQEILHA